MRETQHISLTPEQVRFIEERIASGKSQSVSEVVEEALRLLEAQEQERQATLDRLRAQIQEGADDIDAGRVIDGETVMRESRERLLAKAAKLREAS